MVVRDETVNGCVLRVPDMRHPSLRFHPMLRSVQDDLFKSAFRIRKEVLFQYVVTHQPDD